MLVPTRFPIRKKCPSRPRRRWLGILESLEQRRLLAAVTVAETNGSTVVTEDSGTDTFEVSLPSAPQANVVVKITGGDATEAMLSHQTLTFTANDWNVPQVVTMTGVPDSIADRDQTPKFAIEVDVAASDPTYPLLDSFSLLTTVIDVDLNRFTDPSGGGLAHNNVQPSLAMNYLIALQGTFPFGDNYSPSGFEPFLGEIGLFAGGFVPGGWARAEGQLLQISQHTALFSLLGTTYGGNGETNFALPDLRGRAIIGTGDGPATSPVVLGHATGVETVSLNESQIPMHEHSTATSVTSSIGGDAHHENRQPTLGLNFLVTRAGTFPSPNSNPSDSNGLAESNELLTSITPFAGTQPTGTLARGQILPINQNTAMFSLLGTNYGGDGMTTFGLPDLQGQLAIGATSRSSVGLAHATGVETVGLDETQLPVHDHATYLGDTGETGGGQSHPNVQPSMPLNYIINLIGNYPSPGGLFSSESLGAVNLFAGNFAPRGTALAHGQLLSISSHSALFSLLGTTYGGDGETTFALPDLRDRVPVGIGSGPGLTPRSLGQEFGEANVTLTEAHLPTHQHGLSDDADVAIIVDTLVDELDGDRSVGDLSLREAIALANTSSGVDMIEFDPALSGQTITLSLGQLVVTDDVQINGLGADQLTIDADFQSRIFNVNDGNSNELIDVTISGMTLTGGAADGPGAFSLGSRGGAISSNENLTVDQVAVVGNRALSLGAGIASTGGIDATLVVKDSTFQGNRVGEASGTGFSGGIYLFSGADISNTTVVDNFAASSGGGIGLGLNTDVTISRSTLAGNVGGGLRLNTTDIQPKLFHTIVAGNETGAGAPSEISSAIHPDSTFNLIGDSTTSGGLTNGVDGNQVGVDWKTVFANDGTDLILASNGGPTETVALLPTGAAVDMGDPAFGAPPSYDQRGAGFPRIVNGRIDIGAFESTSAQDFGDAPNSYSTLLPAGASHIAVGPRLGSTRDSESDGQPNAMADGDGGDEDGIMFGTLDLAFPMAGMNIDLQNADSGFVDAWIDFNRDGVWQANEQVLDSSPVIPGMQTKNIVLPPNAVAGETYARVRVSSNGGLSPSGPATNGEIEDYLVNLIAAPPVEVESVQINDGSNSRSQVTSLTVTFDGETRADPNAFIVLNLEDFSPANTTTQLDNINGRTIATITFDEGAHVVSRASGNSLVDGNFGLGIDESFVPGLNSVFFFGGAEADNFFRFFGDSDGDRDVDGQDYGRFGLTFLKSSVDAAFNSEFDSDGDGDVDGQDYGRFGLRFLSSLPF